MFKWHYIKLGKYDIEIKDVKNDKNLQNQYQSINTFSKIFIGYLLECRTVPIGAFSIQRKSHICQNF